MDMERYTYDLAVEVFGDDVSDTFEETSTDPMFAQIVKFVTFAYDAGYLAGETNAANGVTSL